MNDKKSSLERSRIGDSNLRLVRESVHEANRASLQMQREKRRQSGKPQHNTQRKLPVRHEA
jgi:hypothetical protein